MNCPKLLETLEEKFNKKLDILNKRNEERLVDIEKDKQDKKNLNAENEKLDYFEKSFMEKYKEIELAIKLSNEIPQNNLPNHFDAISKKILLLQKFVANSNIFLRGYDIRIFQHNLLGLTTQAKQYEDKLLPKKKFGFKKKNKAKPSAVDNVDSSARSEVVHVNIEETNLINNTCNLTNKTGESLTIQSHEMQRKDVTLNNLNQCKVKLFGTPSTLHMHSLNDCYIFCGPVSTSIFIENCKNCTFVIACQQLRLHKSENINVYLHVTSRAIMEDCNNIYFAPYNLHYSGIKDDFRKSGLDIMVNNWQSIDDFNWLNAEKPSPNWNIITRNDIKDNWDDILDSN